MRKISTKKDEERKDKRNQIVLVVILVFVLLGSTFGVMVNSFGSSDSKTANSIEYGGDRFVYQEGFWVLERQEGTFYFLNTPYETQGILESNNLSRTIKSYFNTPVYVYSENSEAELEIYRNMYPLVERIQNACPEGVECKDNKLPTKSCENNVVIIQESTENKIMQNKNCVYISGDRENLIKISDEYFFRLLGVK